MSPAGGRAYLRQSLDLDRKSLPLGMTVQIALLRAVNLGGATQVAMTDLRERVGRAGYSEVRSLLQSGNLVFRSRETSSEAVEQHLNATLAPRLGASTEFFVRTASEWRSIVERNPFPRESEADPGHLLVTALRSAPSPEAWKRLAEAIVGRERVSGGGREAYIVYPDGVGRSKLTVRLIESKLGTRGTSRNWNTVQKLDAMASRDP